MPNSPYAPSAGRAVPVVLDIEPLAPGGPPGDAGYFVQEGPLPFSSDYLRSARRHDDALARHLPADAPGRLRDGRALRRRRRLAARLRRAGAATTSARSASWASRATSPTRSTSGSGSGSGYVYPMHRIPPSYSDRRLCRAARRRARAPGRRGRPDRRQQHAAGTQRRPQPRLRRRARLRARRRRRQPAHRPALRGQLELHPDLPRAGQVQRAQDAAPRAARPASRSARRRSSPASCSHPTAGACARSSTSPTTTAALPAAPERVTAELFVLAGQRDRERQAAADVGRRQRLRPGRPQPDGPPVHDVLGADAGERSARSAGRARRPGWRCSATARSGAGAPHSGPRSRTGAGTSPPSPRTPTWPRASTAAGSPGRRSAPGSPAGSRARSGSGSSSSSSRSPSNRVTLDRRTDGLGLPRPRLAYDLDTYTRRGMAAARECATQVFALLGAADATTYLPRDAGLRHARRRGLHVPRLRAPRGHAPDGRRRGDVGRRRPPALLGPREPLPGRGGQLADHRDVEPDAHARGARAARRRRVLEDLGERP